MSEDNRNKHKEEYNDEYIAFGNRPRSFSSPEELRQSIQEYFNEWRKQRRPVTVSGLATWLSVSRQTIHEYEKGTYDVREKNIRYSDTIKEAKEYICSDKLEKGLLGIYNSAVAIFDLKNNHDMVDKIDTNNTNTQVVEISDSDREILQSLGIEVDKT
jgi:DNA-binding XRE family transcriptional regulator